MLVRSKIENKLGTEPTLREPHGIRGSKELHVVPDGFEGWALHEESKAEPEGYYDTQEEAIELGRLLANENGVKLITHGQDGKARDETSS